MIAGLRASARGLAAVAAAMGMVVGLAGHASPAAGSYIVVGMNADVRSLDPLTPNDATTTRILHNVYEPLVFRDATNKLVPWLATSAIMSDSGVWTFKLRRGVRFSDGETFDASSVKASIDFILDPAHKALMRSVITAIRDVTIVDPYTVQIGTENPFPGLLGPMTDIMMVPATLLAKGIEAVQKAPVGTGPYRVESWRPNQELRLAANDTYWNGKASVQEVVFRVIPEVNARISALLAGEVDIIPDVPPESLTTVRGGGAHTLAVPGREIIQIGLNLLKPGPLQDVRVRRALNYAVDVDGIITHLLAGYASRMRGPLERINVDLDPGLRGYPYDPDRAKALLREAGYGPGGKPLSLVLNTPQGRYLKDYEVAQEIAQQLQRAGVQISLRTDEWGTYLNEVQTGKIQDLFLLGRGDRELDGTFMHDTLACNAAYVLYCNASLTQQIVQAGSLMSASARAATWRRIQATVVDDAPWIFLWEQHDIYAVSPRVIWQPRTDENILLVEARVR